MTARKDFSQVAFDVMRQATGQQPKQPAPAPEPGLKIAKSELDQRVSPETLKYAQSEVANRAAKKAAKPKP